MVPAELPTNIWLGGCAEDTLLSILGDSARLGSVGFSNIP